MWKPDGCHRLYAYIGGFIPKPSKPSVAETAYFFFICKYTASRKPAMLQIPLIIVKVIIVRLLEKSNFSQRL